MEHSHIQIKEKLSQIPLPLEEGKTYRTKFQTGDHFRITKLITKKILGQDVVINTEGYYDKYPDLLCPLNPERLIPDQKSIIIEIKVCNCCGREI